MFLCVRSLIARSVCGPIVDASDVVAIVDKGKPLGSRPWHQDVATDNDGLSGPSLVRLVVLVATDNDGLSGPSLVRLVVLVAGPVRGLLGSRPWLQDEVVRVWIWSFLDSFCDSAHTPAGPNSS